MRTIIVNIWKVCLAQWLSLQEKNTATPVQILDNDVYISHSVNTLEEGMDQVYLPPALQKT